MMKRHEGSWGLGIARWPIFYKVFVLVGLLVLVGIGGVSYALVKFSYDRLQEQVHAALLYSAKQQAERVTTLLLEQVAFVRHLALDSVLTTEAAARSRDYDPAAATTLAAAWRQAADDSDVVRQVLSAELNPLVGVLQTYAQEYPAVVALLVVDRYGNTLAATYRPEAYDQRDAAWWSATYAEGAGQLAITPPALDARTGGRVLTVSVPMYASDAALIGFVHAIFDVAPLQQITETETASQKRWYVLFDPAYAPVAETPPAVTGGVATAWLALISQVGGVHSFAVTTGERAVGVVARVDAATVADAEVSGVIKALHWSVLAFQPTRVLYAEMRQVIGFGLVLPVIFMGAALGGCWLVARNIQTPVEQLQHVLQQEAAGDQNVLAWVYAEDDLGAVAEGVNRLLNDKRTLTATVARRADERAREQARRQRDLEATAAVGQVTSATLDIAGLAQQVTDLIRERFGLYFVGLFLMNESRTRAALQAGTGEAGASLLARGYRVLPGEGVVGACIADGVSHWNLELTMASTNSVPELPYAHAEVALPLRSRGEVLGAFWALSYHAETFDDEMRIVLQTIADQVAVAVDSIRLFTERQEATVRLQRAYGEATRGAWEDLMRTRNLVGAGYEARVAGVVKLASAEPDAWRIEAREAWAEATPVLGAADQGGDLQEQSLAIPIISRGEVIGVMDVARAATFGEWTAEELAQLESLTSQLGVAMENARLYEDAQERAVRQRLMSDISSRIRASLNVDTVLQTTVREMRALLNLSEAEVRLGVGFETPESAESSSLIP